jgi:hypothetical protein
VAGRRSGGEVAGATYTAWYDGVRAANGLAFAAGGGGADPAEWTAEAWDGGRWSAVAASEMLLWPQARLLMRIPRLNHIVDGSCVIE